MKDTEKKYYIVLRVIISLLYLFFLMKQFFNANPPLLSSPVHVFMALSLIFLFKPLKSEKKILSLVFRSVDLIMIAACLLIAVHYIKDTNRIQSRIEYIDAILFRDKVVFVIGITMLLEGVRRTVGWSLLGVIFFFIAYGVWGRYFPGWFAFSGFSLDEFTEIITLSTSGIFGVTASTAVNFVFYFVFFGVVFSATGGGQVFIDIALYASGRMKGGAAKASLISSALFGTISGSAVANVTTTGVLTIPLMRRSGYSAEQAAATEAIASTGGQLMPPIMGVAAFVMSELLAVPYSRIALGGLIPAVGFYFALFMVIDLRARKTGVGNVDIHAMKIDPLQPRIHLLLAPVTLIAFLVIGFSAPFSALMGIIVSFLAPFLRPGTRYGWKDFFKIFIETARQVANVSIPLAAVGIVMGIAMQSNLAMKFVTMLSEVGNGNLYISLLMVIVGCIIMGMGLPTVAAFIIGSVMFVPALVHLGVDRLVANFFVMYYCVLSMVTPPVALCSYAAAGLAESNTMKTGGLAFLLGLVVFVIPFGFVNDPALLWSGSWGQILFAFIGMLIATFSWAVFIQGWLGTPLSLIERGIYLFISLFLVLVNSSLLRWKLVFAGFLIMAVWNLFLRKRIPVFAPAGS